MNYKYAGKEYRLNLNDAATVRKWAAEDERAYADGVMR